VINFTTVVCRISSRLKRYKKCKNLLRLATVIVKNKMSRFYGSMCTSMPCEHLLTTYKLDTAERLPMSDVGEQTISDDLKHPSLDLHAACQQTHNHSSWWSIVETAIFTEWAWCRLMMTTVHWLRFLCNGMETVQLTPWRRTLAPSP